MPRVAIGVFAALVVMGYFGSPFPHPGNLDWAAVIHGATQAHAAVCR